MQQRTDDLLPFVRAWTLESCQLYWIPVQETPVPFRQRQWLASFVSRFASIAKRYGGEPQTFLLMKVIQPDLRDEFIRSGRELAPVIGLSRRPGEPLPALPDKAYTDDLAKGRIQYDPHSLQPDYAYWFTAGDQQVVMTKFFGSGGFTSLYFPPDPATTPPPVTIPTSARRNPQLAALLQPGALDHINRVAYAMKSKFLKQSKEAFGQDIVNEPQYPGLPFILPLLSSKDFFEGKPAEQDAWFSLFEFYLGESPRDKGVILATRHDIEDDLTNLLRTMREDNEVYPY